MYDTDTIEAARQRDGDRGERPDEIDDLLDWIQVGRGVGQPAAEGVESYERYPDSATELSSPKYAELVERTFRSPAINGYEDARRELFSGHGDSTLNRKRREALQKAAQSAGIDAGELFAEGDERDCGGPATALNALTSDLSDHIVDERNPLCLAFLYVEKSFSVGEIADIFETQEAHIRRRLHDLGLVVRREDKPDGKTAEDMLVNPTADEGEPAQNPSINVSSEAIAKDENITMQKGGE